MSRVVRAAVVRGAGERPLVESLTLAPLQAGEVLIDVAAAGVCHTDLAIASGELWPRYPIVLGHEIAGVVTEVAADVEHLSIGDRVVVMDGHCGRCRDCERGHPVQCSSFDKSERLRHLTDESGATIIQSAGGFSEALISPAHSVFAIPDDVSFEVAAITGCSVVTGCGAVFNVAKVEAGQAVAVLGCGGVGLSAVMAARAAGAGHVVAVDPAADRRDRALSLGATAACTPDEDELLAVHPAGFDAVIECVGRVEAMTLAPRLLSKGGAVVLVGAPPEGLTFPLQALDMVLGQKRVLGCLRGDVRPHVDFDVVFGLYRAGQLHLDELVTSTLPLDRADEAFARAGAGEGIRTVIVPQPPTG